MNIFCAPDELRTDLALCSKADIVEMDKNGVMPHTVLEHHLYQPRTLLSYSKVKQVSKIISCLVRSLVGETVSLAQHCDINDLDFPPFCNESCLLCYCMVVYQKVGNGHLVWCLRGKNFLSFWHWTCL